MSFRKENKYRVTKNECYSLQEALINNGMRSLYNSRIISSIYFDNYDYVMYHDSEEGILPRKKVRIRWYNENWDFSLEKKISSVEGRFKTTTQIKNLKSVDEVLEYSVYEKDYGTLLPALKVSYKRSYFTINDMRITFDTNIIYKNLRVNNTLSHKDPEQVVEIKVPIEASDDFIQTILPNPTTRFTKYCRGLLLSQGQLATI